ncbi:MAG: ATP diphosphatase [Gammaproteobacteria bacterium]|jgi:ATP diphosphatase
MNNIEKLTSLMAALRTPETGCPWDLKQSNSSIAAYTLEETHETLDAIERDDMENLKEELGDMLFHIVFHARIAEERGAFDFVQVVDAIVEKMTRRHPHVFDQNHTADTDEETLKRQWQTLKQKEKVDTQAIRGEPGFGQDSSSQSALNRATIIQNQAAEYGFDWPNLGLVIDKLDEEVLELKQAIESGDLAHVSDELGDVLFVCLNIARHAKIKAEISLRSTNQKFIRRFDYVKQQMQASGINMSQQELEQMESFWQQSKSVVG